MHHHWSFNKKKSISRLKFLFYPTLLILTVIINNVYITGITIPI